MTSRSSSALGASLLSHLLQAGLGLSAAALGAACGGNVVVDGAGGAGGAATGTGTGAGTITGTFTSTGDCNPATLMFGKITACVDPGESGVCLPFDAPELAASIQQTSGVSLASCCGGEVAAVLCGPVDPGNGMCCYEIDGVCYGCEGRPFVVGGAARVASRAPRGDWRGDLCPDVAGLDPAAREALAEAWIASAQGEHASVASFARFALELLSVGAPAAIVASTQRAMGDEIRHAEICFALASAYAGRDVGPGPLAIDGAAPRSGLAEIAAATVREGCIAETLAAFEAAAARDAATDPAVRAALAAIARDEAEHAALAFRFVAWALREGGPSVRAAVLREFPSVARAPDEQADARAQRAESSALRAHGRLSPAERSALSIRCIAEVIAPSAQALLGGASSPGRSHATLNVPDVLS